MPDYQSVAELILKNIALHPEEVSVARSVDDRGVLLTVSANKDDMPHLIGREGKTAEAIRTVVRAIGYKTKSYVSIRIDEPAAVAVA